MGAYLGIAAQGHNGKVIINNVVAVEVPLTVTRGVEKAVGAAKTAGSTTTSAVGTGLNWEKIRQRTNVNIQSTANSTCDHVPC